MSQSLQTLPKEFWLPNEVSKFCRKCDKGFTAVSRKHHCRYCGLIFCNKCAIENQRLNSLTKLERICEDCLILLRSHNKNDSSLKFSFIASFSSDIKETWEQDENILDFVKAIQPNIEKKLERAVQEFTVDMAKKLVFIARLDESWAERLRKTALEVVETVCNSVRFRGDCMDLNKYVKRFRIRSEKESCVFFQGAIVMKSVANKKMPLEKENPKILFLDNRVGVHGEITNIANVVSEESDVEVIFVKKIRAIAPDIIVTTSGLAESIITELAKENIIALINTKPDQFLHLARITRGTVIKSLNECCLFDHFLGLCRKMEVQEFGSKHYTCFTDIQDPTLGGSIIISGPEPKPISKILKSLITSYRNSKLESIFMLECGGQISPRSLIEQYNPEILLKSKQVWKHLVCKELYRSTVKTYTKHDMCLGSFLNLMISMAEESCGRCGNYLKDHVTYFFHSCKVLKICMFRNKTITANDFFLSSNCLVCHQLVQPHYLSTLAWEYSFNKFLWNFFTNSSALSKCGHELFGNNFKFQLGNTQLLFAIKDFSKFEVVFYSNVKFRNEFFLETLNESWRMTQISAKCVLDYLMNEGKGIVRKVHEEVEKLAMSVNVAADEIVNAVRVRGNKVMEEILELMKKIFDIKAGSLINIFSGEALRREIYFKCIQIRTDLLSIEKQLKKSGPVKKQSFLTNSNSFFSELIHVDASISLDEDLLTIISKLNYGILNFPSNLNTYVTVYENDPGSMIAHALASQSYYYQVLDFIGTNFKEFIQDSDNSEWNFTVNSFDGLDIKEEFRRYYGESFSLNVTCYYAKQFHCVRMAKHLNNEQFVLSICKTYVKNCDVGKSSACFKQSHDNRFIIKVVEEKELKMFMVNAVQFFAYFYKSFYEKNDSILNYCLGVYKVQLKNLTTGKSKIENVMIYEKIGASLNPPYIVYDLKGTTNKRRKVKEGEKKTKMDLNFVEDFENLPIPIGENEWNLLKRSINNDSSFLSKCNIVDYSILLVINILEKKIALGIIDYMQLYTFDKVLEHKYKAVVGSQVPTITNPESYKQRFCETLLNHYFMISE